MKILIVNDSFYPEKIYGAGRIAFSQALGMAGRGHQVRVFSSTQDKDKQKEVEYQGLKIQRVYSDYHDRWREYVTIYNPKAAQSFKKILDEFEPEVVHFHNVHSYLCYHLFKLAKQRGAKTFLTTHDVQLFFSYKLTKFINPKNFEVLSDFNYKVSWWDALKASKKRFNPWRRFFIKHYLKYIDQIISVSDALREALKQNGIEKVVTIHNGIEAGGFTVTKDAVNDFKREFCLEDKKVIFYSGNITGQKGGILIMDILKEVASKIPEVVLVTTTESEQTIVGLAKRAGVDERIRFTGWLDEEKIKIPYFVSNLVVVPSVCFDSFPTVNLEAMAAGRPVLATCFGGSRELVIDGETGYVINPYNIADVASKIVFLLKNKEMAQKFGSAGLKRVKENFSLNKQLDQIFKLYDKQS